MTDAVCAGIGLDVGGEAIPYVTGWGKGDATAAVTRVRRDNRPDLQASEAAIEPKQNEGDGQPAEEARVT